MTRHVLERVTDFGDFTRGKELKDFLKQSYAKNTLESCMSDIRLSPDGRHIHIIQQASRTALVTHDRYQRAHLQWQGHVDLDLTRDVSIVDVLYFKQNDSGDRSLLLGIILANGKVEFWMFSEQKFGWSFFQTVDLCVSPRAKITSVCISQNFIVWCEERPPSRSSPVSSVDCSSFTYCVCKRTFDVDERGVAVGGVKTALHNNPRYSVVASGDIVYLLPDAKKESCASVRKVFLSWSPRNDVFKVHGAAHGTLLTRNPTVNKQLDFKRLVSDCIGYLSTSNPPDIYGFSPAGRGDILLLLSSGWVSLMQRDGILRQIYKLPDNCLSTYGTQNSLNMYGDVIALTAGRTMYLIDIKCGMELDRIPLKAEGLLFVNSLETYSPQMFTEAGLYEIVQKEDDVKKSMNSSAVLIEAVFEEACKYYQQRSLSATQLTAEKLRKDGMFQAPLTLADIIGDYLGNGKMNMTRKDSAGHKKLLTYLDSELKSLVALEDIKASVVRASDKDLHAYCESLVQQELCRLLGSEIDRENLHYLNSMFQLFPSETWHAVQVVLRLRRDGEGTVSAEAPAELWKVVLSPVQTSPNYVNSQQKHPPFNGLLPVFELLCQSIFKFQPSWLPRFLELAQQQSTSSSTSSWAFGKENSESFPLYKRALAVLPSKSDCQDLEVELLLCSQRPNAVMQAFRMLIGQGQWDRVTQVAEQYCRQSPLLNKEIFTILLREVSQHRDLDPYLDLLWTLCPDDMTVTGILNIVLKHLAPSTSPFQGQSESGQLTIGLLQPLLSKVLQRDTRSSQRYADILQSPTGPLPAPRRQAVGLARVNNELDIDLKEKTLSGSSVAPV